MEDSYRDVIDAQTPLEYLRAEAAYLRSLDDRSGDAEMMEKVIKETELLLAVVHRAFRWFDLDRQELDPGVGEAAEVWIDLKAALGSDSVQPEKGWKWG